MATKKTKAAVTTEKKSAKTSRKLQTQILNIRFRVHFKLNLTKTKIALLASLGTIGLVLLSLCIYSFVYSQKVYGHVYIGDTDFRGMTKNQAKDQVDKMTRTFNDSVINLNYQGQKDKSYQIAPAQITLNYNADKTTDSVWNIGRNSSFSREIKEQFLSIFKVKHLNASYSYSEDSLTSKLGSIGTEIDSPETDYSLTYQSGKFTLNDQRKAGKRIDQTEIKDEVVAAINRIKPVSIQFDSKDYEPKVTTENAQSALNEANQIINQGDLPLTYASQTFKLDVDTMGGIIKSRPDGNDLELYADTDRLKIFVDSLSQSVNKDPKNVVLKVADGKAVIDQSSEVGVILDASATTTDITNAIFSRTLNDKSKTIKTVALKVDSKKPDISDSDINNLGITELVGTGTTNFVKSPANRVHNITLGATAINGTLVKPGDTFSTLKKLGTIDASTGYLPELVIKNNQTVPDFGGGLCQVSTTLFRAAMNAGLKITERQNHSYRVSYYEPPVGMDASIFDPSPDFKFVNNYDSYLLIESTIVGTKITFDIYGTKDGRVATVSEPTVYDITEPPARIDIPTNTLPAGQTQQVQKAHQGASAKFEYKVVKGDKTLQDKIFTSVYVALPEKWLVGQAAPVATNCGDGAQNGDETGIDCGGSCPNACPAG